jgi:DNA-binding transcriptional ArsR family regulator
VLAALADPVRLVTVRTLSAAGSTPCTELHRAAGLTISQSPFCHHQKILREAGLIAERIEGAHRILSAPGGSRSLLSRPHGGRAGDPEGFLLAS